MMAMMRKRFAIHWVGASIILILAIWLSSGTMAPYAATDPWPLVLEPCHYLANIDHFHFEAVFRMIDADEPETWFGSVVLRRILYPALAYPFVKTFGLLVGGLVATVALHLSAMMVFVTYVRRGIGDRGAAAVLWLLATYPGITYWAGLPYAYASIVPGTLFLLILLDRLSRAETPPDVLRGALLMGVIFLAYDFLPFFAPATILLLLLQKRWLHIVPAVAGLLIPTAAVAITFAIMQVPIVNSNSGTYLTVIDAYLSPSSYGMEWLALLARLPLILGSNFIFSNMIFLSLLALLGWVLAHRWGRKVVELPELALAIAILAVFLVNNLAPPYYGWQMRGEWIARLYQPLFVVLLLIVARVTELAAGRVRTVWSTVVVLTIVANASIAFGPATRNPLAAFAYHKFYAHSPPEALLTNMERFGRRPLGFCRTSHEWDDISDPRTSLNRSTFMYRYPPAPGQK